MKPNELKELKELCERERVSLRQELQNLKSCQITFLTTSVTATGLLLGLATTLASKTELGMTPLGLIFLLPLIVLLPFWWVFFDKASSITRIVGYYRILERIILEHCEAPNFMGWENSIGEFRQMQVRQELKPPNVVPESNKDKAVNSRRSKWRKMLFLQTGHRYWVISYYTFLALSGVCIAASMALLKERWYLASPFAVLFLFSAAWNIRMVWSLIYGHHSYDINEHFWKQILKVRPKTKAAS